MESWVGDESAYYDYQSGKINHEEFLNAVHKMETVNTDWLGTVSYTHLERAVTVEADYPWGWLVYSKLLYGCQRTEEALEAAGRGCLLYTSIGRRKLCTSKGHDV